VIKAPNIVQPRPSQSRPCSGDDHAAPGCCFEQHSVLQSFSRLIGCFSKAATGCCGRIAGTGMCLTMGAAEKLPINRQKI
jgi:hypothetical protein